MTHSIHFEVLDPIKVPIIKKLYKAHYPGTKVKKDEQIVVAIQDKQSIGVVRFRRVEEHQLMTGMLVIPSQREKGSRIACSSTVLKSFSTKRSFALLIDTSNLFMLNIRS